MIRDGFLVEIDVVHADHFAAMDVDHLLVEQIALKQEQSFIAVAGRPLGRIVGGTNAAIDRRDRLRRRSPARVLTIR